MKVLSAKLVIFRLSGKVFKDIILYYYRLIIFNQNCTLKLIVMLFSFLLSLRKEASLYNNVILFWAIQLFGYNKRLSS